MGFSRKVGWASILRITAVRELVVSLLKKGGERGAK